MCVCVQFAKGLKEFMEKEEMHGFSVSQSHNSSSIDLFFTPTRIDCTNADLKTHTVAGFILLIL